MQKYLFVGEDEHYTRDYVTPEELKTAAKGGIKIFELNRDEETVSVYDPNTDAFVEVRRTF